MQEWNGIDWSSWEALTADRRARLGKQLRLEVGVAHQLYEAVDGLQILAKDGMSDDILAYDPADPSNAFVVHLVRSDGPDIDPIFPWTYSIPMASVPVEFSSMIDKIVLELSEGMIWSLQALAQDKQRQLELFPSFVCLPDELIDGFGFEFDKLSDAARDLHPDLVSLNKVLSANAQEPWTDENLAEAPYWKELRRLSREALTKRGLSTFAPHPQEAAYISEEKIHDPFGLLEGFKENQRKSLLSKIVDLFH